MYSNAPVTPQAADLGIAIIQAVLAVLDDPKAAADAVRAVGEAVKLNEQERAQLQADKAFMAEAAAAREKIAEHENTVRQDKQALAEEWGRLQTAWDAHTKNVDDLNAAVRSLNTAQAELAKNQTEYEAKNKTLVKEWQDLVDAQEKHRKVAEALARKQKTAEQYVEALKSGAA